VKKNYINKITSLILTISLALPLGGCFLSKKQPAPPPKKPKRYKIEQDIGPHHTEQLPDLSQIKNAVPKVESKSRIGNPKTYTVFNKTYTVLSTSKDYKAVGKASWYGKKFHGYHTSNGEIYDMYGMSAAHKTLPLPTYVKVTNLSNGKHVIVKVNDRGPFHEDRLIDLSYAAASKLGILNHGTANVEIHAIDPSPPIITTKTYIRLGNYSSEPGAKKLAAQLAKIPKVKGQKIAIKRGKSKSNKNVFHVDIGPIKNEAMVAELTKTVIKNKLPKPIKVKIK
jgi:rare lipoprotein A